MKFNLPNSILHLVLLVFGLRNLGATSGCEDFHLHLVEANSFSFHLGSYGNSEINCRVWCEIWLNVHFFTHSFSCSSTTCWKHSPFSTGLPGCLCWRAHGHGACFRPLCSPPGTHLRVCTSVSLCLVTAASRWGLKSGSVNHPSWFFFFKIVLAILGPLHIHMNFRTTFFYV